MGAREAKADRLVLAMGRSVSQASTRTTLMAMAVNTCWSFVLANPRYRHRRKPKARTAWDNVPSIPARLPYRLRHASVAC